MLAEFQMISDARATAVAGPDRGDHGAGDDRSDAGDAHQAFTSGVPFGKLLDLGQCRTTSSGSTFSPPAICGRDGSKPLRASRCATSARACTKASFSRVVG